MKITWQTALVALFLFLLVVVSCREGRYSPFFFRPESRDPSYPQAELEVYGKEGSALDDDCSTLIDRADSVFLLEVEVGRAFPERLNDSYVRIELDVSVGLHESGLVLADTFRLVVPAPGNYPLTLPLENSKALSSGKNRISIIVITRYLDLDGNLALPMGRKIHGCVLNW